MADISEDHDLPIKKELVENEDTEYPIKTEKVDENPWLIENAETFLKYCCPECDYKSKKIQNFSKHVSKNHFSSNLFRQSYSDVSMTEDQEESFEDSTDNQVDIKRPKRAKWGKCIVQNCSSPNAFGYFKFPKPPEKHHLWLQTCGLKEVKKDDRICADHFKNSDFCLKQNAYPSLNLNSDENEHDPPQDLTPETMLETNVIEMDFKQDDEETHFMTTDEDQSEPAKKEIEEEEFKINYADVKSMKFFRCKICVFESPDKKTYEKHINDNQHQGTLEKQESICPYCNYKARALHKLKIHIDSKHQEHGESKYFCDVCNKGFIFETSYREHSHIRNKKQPNKWCEICDLHVVSLKSHVTEKHEKNGQKICPYCDYKIKEIQSLKYHIDTKHSEHAEKKFFCDICKKGFMFKSIFSSHQGVHKASLKEHICELCGQKYVSFVSLREHMLEKHPVPDATDFVCDICGFTTFSDLKLKRHKLSKHSIEKHKPCPHCEFKAPYNQRINIHIDRIHPEHGEKQFFCNTCGKGFIFKDSFKDHCVYYCRKNPKYKGRNSGTGLPRDKSGMGKGNSNTNSIGEPSGPGGPDGPGGPVVPMLHQFLANSLKRAEDAQF